MAGKGMRLLLCDGGGSEIEEMPCTGNDVSLRMSTVAKDGDSLGDRGGSSRYGRKGFGGG